MTELLYRSRREDLKEVAVLAVEGEIDLYAGHHFKKDLSQMIDVDGAKRVIINLTNIDFIDSAGIGILIGVLKRLRGGPKGTRRPVLTLVITNVHIVRMFKVMSIDKLIPIFSTREEAYQAMTGREA